MTEVADVHRHGHTHRVTLVRQPLTKGSRTILTTSSESRHTQIDNHSRATIGFCAWLLFMCGFCVRCGIFGGSEQYGTCFVSVLVCLCVCGTHNERNTRKRKRETLSQVVNLVSGKGWIGGSVCLVLRALRRQTRERRWHWWYDDTKMCVCVFSRFTKHGTHCTCFCVVCVCRCANGVRLLNIMVFVLLLLTSDSVANID